MEICGQTRPNASTGNGWSGQDELLQFDNAAKVIKNAQGANRAIAPDQW